MKLLDNPIIRSIAGYSLILLGIIGLFLPALQGILLILAGIYVLQHHKIKHTFAKIYHVVRKK
ncbi:TPA: hypothetical protein HA246_05365 [Candidatus Woesearchaeota archaeon]|nr:hypothetical protein [Candidatus Woesearchaeota archaeon]